MKVLYDHQIFTLQDYGGISRYFYELIESYERQTVLTSKISLCLSNNHYLKHRPNSTHKSFFEQTNFVGKERIMSTVNRSVSTIQLLRGNFDVFHPTYYNPYFLKYIGKKPFVITVYDMIHELFPSQFKNTQSVIQGKKECINSADIIICISENTKRDLLATYNVPAEKVKVIYLASSLKPSNQTNSDDLYSGHDFVRPYILYVGNRDGYKNFNILMDAYMQEFSNRFDIVCFGGKPFSTEENSTIRKLGLQNNIKYVNGDDNLLCYFYKNAFCLVYPSLYEGFGIPPLEAMSLSCPVIASNSSSIPEVVGDGGILFDSKSKNSLISAIYRLVDNEYERSSIINKGFKQVNKFNWDKTANATNRLYLELINEIS